MAAASGEERDGVALTNLDQPLFDEAGATKRDLVDYLDAVRDRIIPVLRDRPLSVVRVRPGQPSFMQKNVPKYAPDWLRTVTMWAESSHRDVSYALCDDRRTLLWFANQRAVEYHPTLVRAGQWHSPTHLVLDLDPPTPDSFALAVQAAYLIRTTLTELGLAGAVKTSGAKGLHVFVPVDGETTADQLAAATRAHRCAGGTAGPGARDDRVHPRRPRRQGIPRLDARRRRDRRVGVQPARAARRAGVLSGGLGRPRSDSAVRLHRSHGATLAGRCRSVGGRDAGAAAAWRRPHRGRQCDPDRAGPGHARRQAPRPRAPRRLTNPIAGTAAERARASA